MRTVLLTIFGAVYAATSIQEQGHEHKAHHSDDPGLIHKYQNSMFNLVVKLYKVSAQQSNASFVIPLHSVWIILAAIAEGCNKDTQQHIFKILKFPNNPSIRQKFYKIATTRASLDKDVNVFNRRTLLIDEGLKINDAWLEGVSRNSLLDVVKAPIKSNPADAETQIQELIGTSIPGLNLTGNSILLASINYDGLWTTAFTDAVIERSPFYSQEGKLIGSIDLMKVKRQARMGYSKNLNGKVLELLVGANSLYRILIIIVLDGKKLDTVIRGLKTSVIFEMFDSLKESNAPFDIAIPRVNLSGHLDMRPVLEELGVKSIWTDPQATKFISTPPALPSSFATRSTADLNEEGVNAPPLEQDSCDEESLGLDPRVGTDFIANQPFLMGLFDAETYTPLIGSGFLTPPYPLE